MGKHVYEYEAPTASLTPPPCFLNFLNFSSCKDEGAVVRSIVTDWAVWTLPEPMSKHQLSSSHKLPWHCPVAGAPPFSGHSCHQETAQQTESLHTDIETSPINGKVQLQAEVTAYLQGPRCKEGSEVEGLREKRGSIYSGH